MMPHADPALDPQAEPPNSDGDGIDEDEGMVDFEPLLTLTNHAQHVAWLQQQGLLTQAGLEQLLDAAEQAVGRDPGQARQLAEIGEALVSETLVSEATGTAANLNLRARATYIRAQTHYRNAEFDEALRLIDLAHTAYLSAGNLFEALRVNLGRIAVLSEQGDYAAALDTGRALIANATALKPDATFEISREDITQLLAKAWLNCGACYELKGDYDAALQAFAEAEARYAELGLDELTADIQLNRGVVLLKLGLGQPALDAFEAAHHQFSQAGLTLKAAWARINAADAHLMLGQYTESLQCFAEARRNIEPLEASADKHVLLLDAADAYLDLNLFAEASTAYREAIAALRASGMTHDLARAALGLGTALMGQTEYSAATSALDEAESIFRQGENLPMQVWVLLQQSALQRQQGHAAAARQLADQALQIAAQHGWPMQQIEALLALAELSLADAGHTDVDRADAYLIASKPIAQQLNLPNLEVRLNALLGRLHLLRGEFNEAEAHLQTAVRAVEQLRGGLASDRMRASFVDSRLSAYGDAIELYLQQPDAASQVRAFDMAERAKSRALVDRLSAGQVQPALDPATAQRAWQLQRELEECYSALMSATFEDETAGQVEALQARALQLEQDLNHLELAHASHAAPSGLGQVLALRDIQAQLPAEAVLVSYLSRGDEIIAFVVTASTLAVVHDVGRLSAVQAQLQQLDLQWQRLRANPHTVARHLPQLTRAANSVLRALYGELMERLAPVLMRQKPDGDVNAAEARPLIIVPHGPLHHVPFQALFDGQRHLIDDFEISYAPSGTVFAQCQQQAASSTGRALVVGVADPLIPAAVEEAGAIARALGTALGTATLLSDAEATVSAVQQQAGQFDTVHLACHGLFRADNPMFSSLRLHDGWLMAADIARLRLNGASLVFSACESGRNQVTRGDEVYGLVRAALSAGAASVVASLWLVHDQTTATLMERWYNHLSRGLSRARALRLSQLAVRATQPHPYFWAPFVLIGKR